MKFSEVLVLTLCLPTISYAHVLSSKASADGAPPIKHVVPTRSLKEGAPHWYTIPYDLKYDAKWAHLPRSSAKMNPADEIVVSGKGDFSLPKPYGVVFTTSTEWEEFISSHEVKVTFVTRSSTGKPMRFKTSYQTNDNGFSGWYHGVANKTNTTFTFTYKVPPHTKLKKDFVVLVPEENDTKLIISEAYLEFINE